jgi:hypothetical protein
LGRVILKWISQKCGLKVLTEFNWSNDRFLWER